MVGVWNWGLGCFFVVVFGGVMAGWAVFGGVSGGEAVPNVLFLVLNRSGSVQTVKKKVQIWPNVSKWGTILTH